MQLSQLVKLAEQLPSKLTRKDCYIFNDDGLCLVTTTEPALAEFFIAAREFAETRAPITLSATIMEEAYRVLKDPSRSPSSLVVKLQPDCSPERSVHLALLKHFAEKHCGDRWSYEIINALSPQVIVRNRR